MSKNVKTQLKEVVGRSVNAYNQKVKPKIDDIKFKEQYQGRIIDCMVGEIDDNYIETPETDSPIVKLEYSKEGVVKIPSIKGKTILVDADGNETDTPGEGCKLVSVGDDGELVVITKNKNLNTNVHWGNIYNGEFTQTTSHICSDYIRAYEGVTYTSSIRDGNDVFLYEIYDLQGLHIEQIPATSRSFVAPYDCYFRCWRTKHSENKWLQVEMGKTQTEYVEPQSHTAEILLDEPLRSLPNGVCDERIDNKIIRRVGRVVLDGSERWLTWVNNSPTHNNCYLYINNTNGGLDLKASNRNIIKSDILEKKSIYLMSNKGIYFSYENYLAIGIPIDELGLTDTSDSRKNTSATKQWLSENNVEVLYELAKPITEELPNAIALQGFDDTTVYVESNLNPTVKYGYNAVIPFKQEIQTQKEEVDTNIVDIEDNIIPYLMDVEFNLMMMEDV